jgi:hypothetical protein
MGNGAIGPFTGGIPDPDADQDEESRNIERIRNYYRVIYTDEDFSKFPELTTAGVKVHREGQVLVGREAVQGQITRTLLTYGHMTVDIGSPVSAGSWVSYRIDVRYGSLDSPGVQERVRGVGHSRLSSSGRISETWVSYEPPETLP